MNRLPNYCAPAAAAILTAGLAACSGSAQGSAGGTPAASDPIGYTVPTFQATIQVTGAVRYAKTFSQPVPGARACAAVAAHGDVPGGLLKVPTPPAGQDLSIDIQIAGYHGVGTYPPSDLQKDNSDSIQLTVKGVRTTYVITSHPAKPAVGQAQVKQAQGKQAQGKEVLFAYKGGSGQLAFSEAHKLGRKSGPAIAGVINWKCIS
jgi:hypothetical protein